MRKAVMAVLIPFGLVASAAIGFVWWDRGAPPGFKPTLEDVDLATINRNHRGVRIKGTAHYEVRLTQTMADGDVFAMFPLLEQGDSLSREIVVLVRTPRMPERLVTFEDVVVEGLARPPGRLVGPKIRAALEAGGYHFTERYVLIDAFDVIAL